MAFVDIEIDLTDESLAHSVVIISNKLEQTLDPASFDMFTSHDKTTHDNLAIAIGKAYINDMYIAAIKTAIDASEQEQSTSK